MALDKRRDNLQPLCRPDGAYFTRVIIIYQNDTSTRLLICCNLKPVLTVNHFTIHHSLATCIPQISPRLRLSTRYNEK